MASLTDHQQDVFDTIYERLAEGERFTSLRGYAGTGKTFLVSQLVEQLAAEDSTVTACAPTHRATQVLRSQMNGADVPTQTLHSFLGLRLVPDRDGAYVLEPEGDLGFYSSGIVVVDEASMIGEQEWTHIQQAPRHLQWLFVGDPAQLPPVNESNSPVFDVEGPQLENVHRQSADNPIVQLAHQVRQPGAVAFRSNYDGESGVAVTDSAEGFVESALRTFQSDAFRKDATTARVLAYRNKTVRAYNRRIRQALYGDDAERFTKGEWLMIRETWYYNNMPYLKNSEEVRVKKAQTDTYEAEDGSEWKVWRLSVKSVRDAWNRIALVLHEDEHERFEEELERKKMDAKESPRKWERYYELKERFTQVDYAYATTTHKAQGSTFDTVFVDYRDLQACRGPEQQALLYVAITRPSRRLAMLV